MKTAIETLMAQHDPDDPQTMTPGAYLKHSAHRLRNILSAPSLVLRLKRPLTDKDGKLLEQMVERLVKLAEDLRERGVEEEAKRHAP